jgi:cyclopropane fatty-acyl-phospholipid synthase-like methyltransferase
MDNSSYKEFSQIYDLLMNDIDYERWTSFIADKLGDSVKILEAACGTGSITCLLAEKNYKVTAFDLSEDMLMKAYEKLGRNPGVKLLNQDMRNFKIDEKFDGAVCCCDAVNYLSSEEVAEFFRNVRDHLKNGSKFIFDISTEYKYRSMYNDTYVYDDGNVFYAWENVYDEEKNLVDIEINFFVNDKNNKYNRITEIQTQYIHSVGELNEMLEASGFGNIEIYDDYSDEKVRDDSLRAVFHAAKL